VPSKEKIFNYEHFIGGVDIKQSESQISQFNRLSQKHPPESLIDQFNKKLLEKGTDRVVQPSDLPQGKVYLEKKFDRPSTSRPIPHKKKINLELGEGHLRSVMSGSTNEGLLSAQSQGRKGPKDRLLSAKHEKLPPPPVGKTMGHGLIT
jgi:hypothetical protein